MLNHSIEKTNHSIRSINQKDIVYFCISKVLEFTLDNYYRVATYRFAAA